MLLLPLVACLFLGCRARESQSPRAVLPRILLIGIDGADMGIIDRLIAEGKLPTFSRLKREGAAGPLLSIEPLLSPIVWTSIATGRRPQDHGVFDFLEITPAGDPVPITSDRRKVPALWNIAGQFGKTSGFIGWYASFPAEKVKGFEISDRLAFHQVRSERATVGATFPEGLEGDLYREFGEPHPDLAATRARFLSHPDAPVGASGQKRLEELAKIYATSEFYRKITPHLQRRFGTDLLAVYFEGIDACGHLFMEDAPPRRRDVSDGEYAAFSETVDRYYQYQDEVLADLLRLEGERTVTIVCSDHGFKSGVLRPRTSGRADTGVAGFWHRLFGVIFVHGHAVLPGSEIRGATVLDIVPTVASLLPVPLSRELPGHPLQGVFGAGAIPEGPGAVERYAARPKPDQRTTIEGDPEAVRKLAALGYLSGAGKAMAHDEEGRTAGSYLNEGTARAASGDQDGALRAFGRVLQLDPKNVGALSSAAGILISRQDFARAEELLERALTLKPEDVSVRMQRATVALQTGQWAAAAAELEAAGAIDDRLPLLHVLQAALDDATGRPEEALRELDEAEKLSDPADPLSVIYTSRAQIAAALGRADVAEAAANRAAALVPESDLSGVRADIAMARHDPAAAARFLRQAIAARPRSSQLEGKLGKALEELGDPSGAEAALRQAIAKARTPSEKERGYADLSLLWRRAGQEDRVISALLQGTRDLPQSPVLWGMLGGAFARASRWEEAIAADERSVALKPTASACKALAALVFEKRHDRARAVALWRQSLALKPDQPDVRSFLKKWG